MFEKLHKIIKSKHEANKSLLKFKDFLDLLEQTPDKLCRDSTQYIKDCFDYYGNYSVTDICGNKILRWKLFDKYGVYGHEKAQNQIYSYLNSTNNKTRKIILLHGPNGSAKSSTINAIMSALEDYSSTDQGAVYSINWIFNDIPNKDPVFGFGKIELNKEDSEDILKIKCDLKDHPILILPKEQRQEFFTKYKIRKSSYLLEGDLCPKCNEIMSQLILKYEGDFSKVMDHIQIERFFFSKRYRKGLVSIEPQKNVDASSNSLDRSYKLPNSLYLSNIHEPFGDLIDANRGLVELSEIFKRHSETNKYLLTTSETGQVSLPGINVYLDCVIFATGNEADLAIFKMSTDWPSFSGRFSYVKVPYLLKYSDEEKIYEKIFDSCDKHIAPHSKHLLALWAVCTRFKKTKQKVSSYLTNVQKAFLYGNGGPPENWSDEERRAVLNELKSLTSEFEETHEKLLSNPEESIKDAGYEGRRGASSREVVNILTSAANSKEFQCVSPLSLLKSIETLCKDKHTYEFLRLGDQYADTDKIIKDIKNYFVSLINKDIRISANLVSDEEYSKLFEKYILNVKAWNRGEKLQSEKSGESIELNTELMSNIEFSLGIIDKDEWRKNVLSKIASWAINNLGKPIPYNNLFSDSLEILKNANIKKYQEKIDALKKGLIFYGTEDWGLIPQSDQILVESTYKNMIALGYDDHCLKEAIQVSIRSI